jgi:1-phosphofructokinase family hexose kinase
VSESVALLRTPNILCVSLNPAIDRRIVVRDFHVGEVNRALSVDAAAGGKAAHVAYAVQSLGGTVHWLGFLGGPEGEAFRAGFVCRGVKSTVVPIAARTRMTLELIDESTKRTTEVLEPGPVISEVEAEHLKSEFSRFISECRIVVVSGSLPTGLSSSFYSELISVAKAAGCCVLLDSSGEALSVSLASQPDLIKPNLHEAGALLGKELKTLDDGIMAARSLKHRGARSVLLSLGSGGALLVDEAGKTYVGVPPRIQPISVVGCGDSLLGAYAVAISKSLAAIDALRFAIAAGSANCLAESPGILSAEQVATFVPQVDVKFLAD